MNSYELLYILDNGIADEAKESVIEKLSAVVTDMGGKIDTLDKWGAKKLAYPMEYKTEGYYVLVNFVANSDVPAELERVMKITDSVIRFMIVKK